MESKNERRSIKVRQESYDYVEQIIPILEDEMEVVSNISRIDAEAMAVRRGVEQLVKELRGEDVEVSCDDGEILIGEQTQD